MKNLEDSNLRF